MLKLIIICFALAVGSSVRAADARVVVDLRDANAVAQLEESNPEHFRKILRTIEALTANPTLAESGWLQTNVDARDVDLSRYMIRTSYPPKQLLQFTIDDTRYVMHLVRSDMAARTVPAE